MRTQSAERVFAERPQARISDKELDRPSGVEDD